VEIKAKELKHRHFVTGCLNGKSPFPEVEFGKGLVS
jgi:hypothetical protein